MRILSFGEGPPSRVSALLPRLVVVPPESAFPGFGDFHPLPDLDHIQARRPPLLKSVVRIQDLWIHGSSKRNLPIT